MEIGFPKSRRFFLIAGPCVLESEELAFEVAGRMKEITDRLGIEYIFKSSYDKANRTSIKSYRGPGLEKGLRILSDVKSRFGVRVLTDVHETWQVKPVSEVVDVIQIPAFLSRQTDLLIEAGKTGRTVNVKKGQFIAPWDVGPIIEKIESTGNRNIWITERGYIFGYNNLVVDFRGIPIMRQFGYPVVYDATHSLQRPSGKGGMSGGDRELIIYLARAAVAVGVDGIFMEVHPEPDKALSDPMTQFPLDRVEELLRQLISIEDALMENS